MLEEYFSWEDEIRFTLLELAEYMENVSNPLDTIIDFAWSAGADRFWVNNAKDELKRLKEENLKLKQLFEIPVAFGKINDRFDLYDLRTQNNPYHDQNKVVPLYSNKEEFIQFIRQQKQHG